MIAQASSKPTEAAPVSGFHETEEFLGGPGTRPVRKGTASKP